MVFDSVWVVLVFVAVVADVLMVLCHPVHFRFVGQAPSRHLAFAHFPCLWFLRIFFGQVHVKGVPSSCHIQVPLIV